MADRENLRDHNLSAVEEQPKYYIDVDWFVRQDRSFEFMIESRVAGLEMVSVTGGRARKKRPTKGISLEEISKFEGFVKADLPVLEAVFRLLLVHENKPMDVGQISQELAEAGLGVLDARMITSESLIRMIDRDFHYGLSRYLAG